MSIAEPRTSRTPALDAPERKRVLGAPVDVVTPESALAFVRRRVAMENRRADYIVAINPEKVCAIRADEELASFVEDAALLIPDGIGVVLAMRSLYGASLERVAGADLMQAICKQAAEQGHRVFLYGSSEEVNAGATEELQQRHPDLTIAGRANGFVPEEEMSDLVDRINSSNADILFIALGSPRQERWIRRHRDALNVKLCMGVGGTLDTIVGRVKRAPMAWQRVGLEWLYRLLKQPTRWRRQVNLLRFVLGVLWCKATGRR